MEKKTCAGNVLTHVLPCTVLRDVLFCVLPPLGGLVHMLHTEAHAVHALQCIAMSGNVTAMQQPA
jgi:hypothetical protein